MSIHDNEDMDCDDYNEADASESEDEVECYGCGGAGCPTCDGEGSVRREFADPGGVSALRVATPGNPRDLPCPTCHEPNRLTAADKALGYQCDSCANRAEGGGYGSAEY